MAEDGRSIFNDFWNVLAFADYNFFADRKFSPYLGLGVGGGKGYAKILEGFEIKSIYRISLEEYFNTDGSRAFQVTVAFVLPKDN